MPKPKQTDFITIRGRTSYAKVLGKPVPNYDGNGTEWKLDLIPLDEVGTRRRLKELGIADRLRQKEDYLEGAPHMTIRQKGEKADGEANDPPRVVDVTGAAWDATKLIGNGSVVDVKLRVADYGKGMKKGMYIAGIRVLELVAYKSKVFDDLDEDDPYYQAAQGGKGKPPFDEDDDGDNENPDRGNADDLDDDIDLD